jgi:hypothetical protein
MTEIRAGLQEKTIYLQILITHCARLLLALDSARAAA